MTVVVEPSMPILPTQGADVAQAIDDFPYVYREIAGNNRGISPEKKREILRDLGVFPYDDEALADIERRYGSGVSDVYLEVPDEEIELIEPMEMPAVVRPKQNTFYQWLVDNGIDPSYSNRAKLAAKWGITAYKGTYDQNMLLWTKLRDIVAHKNKFGTESPVKIAIPRAMVLPT